MVSKWSGSGILISVLKTQAEKNYLHFKYPDGFSRKIKLTDFLNFQILQVTNQTFSYTSLEENKVFPSIP